MNNEMFEGAIPDPTGLEMTGEDLLAENNDM